jgi:acyl transferase domain-containing protein
VFAETVTRCAEAVDDILPRPLLEVMFATDRETGGKASDALRDTSFAQPALFAVEMGLARLWQSWGIEPDVVLGHSVGQYAAACVAGVFSLEDGARLIAERGRLFGSQPEGGRMVAVFADPKHVEEIASEFPRISVGAYNGPNTVLSGPGEDLQNIVTRFEEDAIRCTWLQTSHAFHSQRNSDSPPRHCRWSATAPAPCSHRRPRWMRSTGDGIPGSPSSSPKACAPRRPWAARC